MQESVTILLVFFAGEYSTNVGKVAGDTVVFSRCFWLCRGQSIISSGVVPRAERWPWNTQGTLQAEVTDSLGAGNLDYFVAPHLWYSINRFLFYIYILINANNYNEKV